MQSLPDGHNKKGLAGQKQGVVIEETQLVAGIEAEVAVLE
jgi:hypothetical protein